MAVIADELRRIPMSQRLMATLALAAEFAQAQHHPDVSLEHLLLALTDDGDAGQVLSASHVDSALLKADVSQFLSGLPTVGHATSVEQLQIAPDLRRILEAAAAAASQGRRREINGAIVLAAIVGDGKSSAAHMLRAQGLTFEEAIKALQRALAASTPPPPTDAEDILATARARVQNRSMPGMAATSPAAGRPAKDAPAATAAAPPTESSQPAPPAPPETSAQQLAERPQPAEAPPPKIRPKIAIDDFRNAMTTELIATEHDTTIIGADASAFRTIDHDGKPKPVAVEQADPPGVSFEQMVTVPWPSETTLQDDTDLTFQGTGYLDARLNAPGDLRATHPNSAAPQGDERPAHTGPPSLTSPTAGMPDERYSAVAQNDFGPRPENFVPAERAGPERTGPERTSLERLGSERASSERSGLPPAEASPLYQQRPRPPMPQPSSRWPAPVGPAWQQEPARHQEHMYSHAPDADIPPHTDGLLVDAGFGGGFVPPPLPPLLIDSIPGDLSPSESAARYGASPPRSFAGPGDDASWPNPVPNEASPYETSLPPPPPLPPADGVALFDGGPATVGAQFERGLGYDPISHYGVPSELGMLAEGNHGGRNLSGSGFPGLNDAAANVGREGFPLHPDVLPTAPEVGNASLGYFDGYSGADGDRSAHAPQISGVGRVDDNTAGAVLTPTPAPNMAAPIAPLTIDGPDVRGRGVAVDKVIAGQLVENIPRRLRVGYPSTVQVRVANADARRLLDSIDGSSLHYPVRIAPCISVKLRAPDGGFVVDGMSRETQWIENSFETDREFAEWRWTVTPTKSGRARLQLLLSARTANASGTSSDTMLPDQVVEVSVGANYGRIVATGLTWTLIAIAGGLFARFGGRIYDPIVASIVQFVR